MFKSVKIIKKLTGNLHLNCFSTLQTLTRSFLSNCLNTLCTSGTSVAIAVMLLVIIALFITGIFVRRKRWLLPLILSMVCLCVALSGTLIAILITLADDFNEALTQHPNDRIIIFAHVFLFRYHFVPFFLEIIYWRLFKGGGNNLIFEKFIRQRSFVGEASKYSRVKSLGECSGFEPEALLKFFDFKIKSVFVSLKLQMFSFLPKRSFASEWMKSVKATTWAIDECLRFFYRENCV